MSVMFEILERLERKDAAAGSESGSNASSIIMQDALIFETAFPTAKSKTPAKKTAASASRDLSNLSKLPFKTPGSLIDIRFDAEAPSGTSKAASRERDFPSIWAMARLCNRRSPMRGTAV